MDLSSGVKTGYTSRPRGQQHVRVKKAGKGCSSQLGTILVQGEFQGVCSCLQLAGRQEARLGGAAQVSR